jgi:roadblock/LC7 domain-containing protein
MLIGINSDSSLVDDKIISKLKALFSNKKYDANKEMFEFVNKCFSIKYKKDFFPIAHYENRKF